MAASFDPTPVAERVWHEVGYRPDFPRDLIQPVMETFDLAVILLPRLSINAVAEWLAERGRAPICLTGDRLLSGCLLAQRGHGLAFINGSLDPDERRFAVAHELAHFFAHYLIPRRRALARFGPSIQSVLDGDRSPTVAERLSEILRNTPLGPYQDFLTRDAAGWPDERTQTIETEADLIALEMLAPRASIIMSVGASPTPTSIASRFGIPNRPATLWARYVAQQEARQDPFILSIERAVGKNA